MSSGADFIVRTHTLVSCSRDSNTLTLIYQNGRIQEVTFPSDEKAQKVVDLISKSWEGKGGKILASSVLDIQTYHE